MALSTQITAQQGSIFARMSAAIEGYTAGFAKYRVFRTTLNEMNALSDRELGDLGLHRSHLRRIAYQAAYEAN